MIVSGSGSIAGETLVLAGGLAAMQGQGELAASVRVSPALIVFDSVVAASGDLGGWVNFVGEGYDAGLDFMSGLGKSLDTPLKGLGATGGSIRAA